MPWHIAPDHADCSGFAVVKDSDGSVAGCHETEAAAQKQVAALYASEQARTIVVPDAELNVRDESRRLLDVRIVPWDVEIQTHEGVERFARGAFADVDAARVMLMEPEHEARIGLGQDGKPVMMRRPAGRGVAGSLEDRDDGAYMQVKVAGTAAGDDIIALARDGVATGISAEFYELPGGTKVERRRGRQVKTHQRVDLRGIVTTYRPAYRDAAVIAVRTEEEEGETEVTQVKEVESAPETAAVTVVEPTQNRVEDYFARLDEGMAGFTERFAERLGKVEEQYRSSFSIPHGDGDKPTPKVGEWMEVALKILSGDRIPEAQFRVVAELITTDNAGIVPDTHSAELIGVIDASRPFMSSTRRMDTPATGLNLVVPKITARPTVAVQAAEKDELSSSTTTISSVSFPMVSKGGVGDISLQLLKRADRSYLALYLELLAEAYALECEEEALRALFDEVGGGITGAGPLAPANLLLGSAYQTSFDAIRRPPDTIWLSTEAVGEFIDAKATTTNQPLYPGLTPAATAGGGIRGTISGLNAVHVPALDAHGAFAVVGPSSGFAWAEDGTYTLQVDVPSKAGRDVALVGMLWFCPWYPAAFSIYNVAS